MTDDWKYYPCQMGERRAFIFFNDGIASALQEVTCETLVSLRVSFKAPDERGLPARAEFDELRALEDRIEEFVRTHDGRYVGRITVGGARYFHTYTDVPASTVDAFIREAGSSTGYEIKFRHEPDPERNAYWKELYPTADDRQVLEDLRVLEPLKQAGDAASTPRLVDHWAYFPTHEARERFETWTRDNGFELVDRIEPEGDRRSFGLRVSHVGTMQLEDITHRTIGLNRAARQENGDYDGWETSVEKPD